jgi:hypothetical protein
MYIYVYIYVYMPSQPNGLEGFQCHAELGPATPAGATSKLGEGPNRGWPGRRKLPFWFARAGLIMYRYIYIYIST